MNSVNLKKLLIFSTITLCISNAPLHSSSKLHIESPLLQLMDGQINIARIFVAIKHLKELLNGRGSHKEGLINFHGTKHSIKELAQMEQEIAKRGDPSSERCQMKEALKNTIEEIRKAMLLFEKDIDVVKQKRHLGMVIDAWAKQRKHEDSLLIKWASVDEQSFLTHHATSHKAIERFAEDLIILLHDVCHSCPKSFKKFEENKAAMEERHKHKNT